MPPYYAPNFLVKIDGLTMEADISRAVIDLTYDNSIDTADMFSLEIDNSGLRFTDSPLFDIGKTVEIYMGYASDLHPMMLGEIAAVNPSFPASGAPTLHVTGYDRSHRMRDNYTDRSFRYMNESAIAAQVAIENLLIPVIDPLPTEPAEAVMQTESDWALLKQLADRFCFNVYVRWDKLYFQAPRPQTELVALEWGKNLVSFSPRLSTAGQAGVQVIRGYDAALAQAVVASIPVIALDSDLDTLVERLGGNILDLLTNLGRQVIQDEHPTNFAAAALIARSVLKTMLEGMYEGSGSCIGMPALRAGDQIEIRGLGKRFSGRYRLSKVTHSINSGGYQTRFEVSQKANLNLLGSMRDKITERPSPNGKQPIYGVLVGEVTLNNDPKHLGQVQVKIDVLSDQPLPAWAYLATSMAGVDKGLYFLPAVGDRVLVAFEKGNVNKPYVVGTLWHGEAHPPDAGSTPGEQKVIQTKSGLQVLFDEAQGKERLVLKDKAGASITLDSTKDAEKTVIERPMPQKKVATISLDAGAKQIVIEYAQSQIIVKENGDISIIAHRNLELTAQGDIMLDAKNVKVRVSESMDVSS